MPESTKTAVILTAIGEETRAVLRHLSTYGTEDVSGTHFFVGAFGVWQVAVAEIGPGNAGAAAIGTRAFEHYKPDVALFVGVAGGVKDVAIGDVVVATKVYGYESGRDIAGGFKARPDLMNTSHDLEQRARGVRQGVGWKRRFDPAVQHKDPKIFVEPIAAGEKVVASTRSATAALIGKHYSDAVAVEMEGRGFLEAVHVSHPVRGGVVRGISDLLSKKADADKAGSKAIAADAASAVAFEMLSAIAGGQAPQKSAAPFIETSATFSPSAYFKRGEVLAKVGDPNSDQVQFSFAGAPGAFLRIIPTQGRGRPIPLATLREVAPHASLLYRTRRGGEYTDLNDYGAVVLDLPPPVRGGPARLYLATQLFPNGELWSVSDKLVVREREGRPYYVPIPFVGALDLEQSFCYALHRNIAVAAKYLGLSFPCTVEFGLVGIANVPLIINTDDTPLLRMDAAIVRQTVDAADVDAINAALFRFFNEVHDKTGYARPVGFNGFPPGPSRPAC